MLDLMTRRLLMTKVRAVSPRGGTASCLAMKVTQEKGSGCSGVVALREAFC